MNEMILNLLGMAGAFLIVMAGIWLGVHAKAQAIWNSRQLRSKP